ncbi:MAG: hypothetical protein HYR95_02350 [Candidatus Colwellbacteria bacterium]|nr:hypothetical protein [Candidatus Colwellbacteria bacterium]MBI3274189.1 hypothetical protein [Candidatus Colwellbacteria bacterium]
MRYFYGALLLITASVLLIHGDVLSLKFSTIRLLGNVGQTLDSGGNLQDRIAILEKENEDLRVQIFNNSISSGSNVKVYSSYPFNSRKDIIIAGGSNDGFKDGDVVTFGDKILIGRISAVFNSSSIVKTVFDADWEMAVRIGVHEVDGLFKGGSNPTVTLIPQEADIKAGDLIISSSSEFPYGLEVGIVKNINDVVSTPFKAANVDLGVQLWQLKDVKVHH